MRFGWDISTSIIGVSAWDEKYLYSKYLDLRKLPTEPLFEKAAAARQFVEELLGPHRNIHIDHYIEERLGNFAGGRSMIQVLMKLGAFNQLVSWHIWDFNQKQHVQYIHPSTAKAAMKPLGLIIPKGADKKELTLTFVKEVCPGFPHEVNKNGNPQPWCYDMADSYITGLAGLLKAPCSKRES
jgi:aromatic ring-cleaving dioxygenase